MILGNPVPSSTTEPRAGQVQDRLSAQAASEIASVDTDRPEESRTSFRVAKAIGLYPPTNAAAAAAMLDRQSTTTMLSTPGEARGNVAGTGANPAEQMYHRDANVTAIVPQRAADNADRPRNPATKKDTKITWILTASKSGRSKYEQQEEKVEEKGNRNGSADQVEDLTVLPLQDEVSRIRLVLNKTKSSSFLSPSLSSSSSSSSSLSSSLSSSAGGSSIRTFNRSDDDVEIDEEFIEPQLFATAASILEGNARLFEASAGGWAITVLSMFQWE